MNIETLASQNCSNVLLNYIKVKMHFFSPRAVGKQSEMGLGRTDPLYGFLKIAIIHHYLLSF